MSGKVRDARNRFLVGVAVGFMIICGCTVPLAQVAETFHHDVVRRLNTCGNIYKSQQHFGGEFLAHLQGLQWGFRIPGAMLDMRLAMTIYLALIVTLLTAASQSILDEMQ